MDDTELRTITFKVSNEEAEAIDRAAREGGLHAFRLHPSVPSKTTTRLAREPAECP